MSNQMKIGIVCPIGNLEKFGYHHIYEIVLQSWCSFADYVVLISSSRDAHVAAKSPKIQLISSPQTWFDLDKNGNECYSMDKLISNENLGLDILAESGFDMALILHINQYISETKFDSIRKYLQDFFQRDKPFTWLYKMYQCGSQLFDADRRIPWIYNLHHRNQYMKGPDSTLYHRNWLFWHPIKRITIQSGSFKAFNDVSIVDIVGEFTENECGTLWSFVRDRGGYNPKGRSMLVDGVYYHDVWLKYMTRKLQEKHPSSDQLDIFGTAICEQSEPEFVCHELIRRIQP
jgi:hypothetical protein